MLHEPPGLSSDMFQWYLAEPLRVTSDGFIVAPASPGLGVEPDPAKIARYQAPEVFSERHTHIAGAPPRSALNLRVQGDLRA